MALGPQLSLRTAQTLTLSPQLQVAIRLLALSNLELQAEITREMERNPLLELADGDGNAPEAAPVADDPADAAAAETAPPESAGVDTEIGGAAIDNNDLDVDLVAERFHHDSFADSGGGTGENAEAFLENMAAEAETLTEVLERQSIGLPPIDRAIALALIGHIDDAGYLTEPVANVAASLGTTVAEVERVLAVVQMFEPTGVGARTLSECIALQAREADRYDPCMAALIDNLDLVARGDVAQLRRLCAVDAEDLADMLRELRGYDPKPGLRFGRGRTLSVVPDVFVRRAANGDWLVELNSATLPRLLVNRGYQARLLSGGPMAKTDRQFVDQCLSQAHWLIRALDQRANTILKVVTTLLREQEAFFLHGVQHLKPLTLRTIADMIDMHESTVSRVTSNKYLSCERGLFELKYFFANPVQSVDGGADASVEAVRLRLKQLIDAEAALKPLSDDRLARILKEEGFDLARRTVTKYREAMQIPSSFDRRRRALVNTA